mmetsp:Transcript_10898/g.27419  ORF Transcript_10898/g.27419 Transcript_10898/m.27419 type:complete len:369 (-) Transcript_10898:1736-2842(-)
MMANADAIETKRLVDTAERHLTVGADILSNIVDTQTNSLVLVNALPILANLSPLYPANSSLAHSTCLFIEAALMPVTDTDRSEEERDRQEDTTLRTDINSALISDCLRFFETQFGLSGAGEVTWLCSANMAVNLVPNPVDCEAMGAAIKSITSHAIRFLFGRVPPIDQSLDASQELASQRPDLVEELFKLNLTCLEISPEATAEVLEPVLACAIASLAVKEYSTARVVLSWLRGVLKAGPSLPTITGCKSFHHVVSEYAASLVVYLFLGLGGRLPHRSNTSIAEALWSLMEVTAVMNNEAVDPRGLLKRALSLDGVPASNLTAEDRLVIESCLLKTAVRQRRFKAAIADISRVCRNEMTIDVLRDYDL